MTPGFSLPASPNRISFIVSLPMAWGPEVPLFAKPPA